MRTSCRFSSCWCSRSTRTWCTRPSPSPCRTTPRSWILEKTVSDRSYGARPLRRALQRFIEDPLSEALIAGQIAERPAFLEVYLDNNTLHYRPVAEEGDGKSPGFAMTTA